MKIFILDTNVLMHDPGALSAFAEHTVVIPSVVLEELDNHKRDQEKGYCVREAIRKLEEMVGGGNIIDGVKTPGGGILKVDTDGDDPNKLPMGFERNKPDNIILLTTRRIQDDFVGQKVILVTKDTLLRLKAQSLGLESQDYLSGRAISKNPIKETIVELSVPEEIINLLYSSRNRRISLEEAGLKKDDLLSFKSHTCLRLKKEGKPETNVLAILSKISNSLELVTKPNILQEEKRHCIHSRNEEQAFALALAMSPNIKLLTLSGPAGSGKSLMALYAGWRQAIKRTQSFENHIIEENLGYPQKMIIYRPTREIGAELGFLPGTLKEKIAPWQRPTRSNLELIAAEEGLGDNYIEQLLEKGTIEILPINHIRGNTDNNAFIIIDDAQNFTPKEIKAAITRVGNGSKMIITGDSTQVDVLFLDAYSNGFTHTLVKFSDIDPHIYAHLELKKSERSLLAGIAASIL